MELEVVAPGDDSDGSELFELQAGHSRQELCVKTFRGSGKAGILVAISGIKFGCSSFCTQCWEGAIVQPQSQYAGRVFKRCEKDAWRSRTGTYQNINTGQL